jgi:hypothetical protein
LDAVYDEFGIGHDETWRRRQQHDGQPVGVRDPMFTNERGEPVNPESISQLFDRKALTSGLPKIRLHDLRPPWVTMAATIDTIKDRSMQAIVPRPRHRSRSEI